MVKGFAVKLSATVTGTKKQLNGMGIDLLSDKMVDRWMGDHWLLDGGMDYYRMVRNCDDIRQEALAC